MHKDSAISYEQKSWEYAVREYVQLQGWKVKLLTANLSRPYVDQRLKELEDRYPQLKS